MKNPEAYLIDRIEVYLMMRGRRHGFITGIIAGTLLFFLLLIIKGA
ncbi:MAG: hypothetical protein ACE5K4_05250 [Candidatus Hydrothermarchaeota archaeon]